MNKAARLTGFAGALGATAMLVATAAGSTGAYFSDSTDHAEIKGTVGSISVVASGTAINFTDLLPGEPQQARVNFTNDGRSPQDVWIVFDETDLGDGNHGTDDHLINDQGSFAEIHVKAFSNPVFDSNNLNDDGTNCPPGVSDATHGPCAPLPGMLKLASGLLPGASGDMDFSYMIAAKKTGQTMTPVHLGYKIVATQQGIAPNNPLN